MRPKVLGWAMVALIVVAVVTIVAAVVLWTRLADDGAVDLVGFSDESTETVSFAGSFPPDDWPALNNPLSIATDGELFYVAEADSGIVHRFTSNGGTRGEIVITPAEGLEVAYPADVAVLDEETLLVVDTAGERVGFVPSEESEGAELAELRPRGVGGRWGAPSAVAVGDRFIWVADSEAGGILRYERDGEFLDVVADDLGTPLGLVGAMGVHGRRVYVSDSVAGRVVVLGTQSGEQIDALARQMALPRGVAVGLDDRVWVSDRFSGTVEAFGQDGAWLEAFGDGVRTGIVLSMPNDVVWFDETSRLYVADAAIGRIAVYNTRLMPAGVSP